MFCPFNKNLIIFVLFQLSNRSINEYLVLTEYQLTPVFICTIKYELINSHKHYLLLQYQMKNQSNSSQLNTFNIFNIFNILNSPRFITLQYQHQNVSNTHTSSSTPSSPSQPTPSSQPKPTFPPSIQS